MVSPPSCSLRLLKNVYRPTGDFERGLFANPGSLEEPDMLDRSLEAEFESYRKTLSTDEAKRAFDERIERLLSQHGVDYVRGYVDALKDASSGGSGG
jgi:hypothetical protein